MNDSPGISRIPLLAASAAAALAMAGLTGTADAAAAAGPAAGPASGQHLVVSPNLVRPDSTTAYTSHNWDGYFTTDSSDSTDFTAVSAQWVEPKVTCNSNNSYAGFWIGFDGWWNESVEQDGTAVECTKGKPSYHVWWEMYPYNEVQNGFAISPGDKITASVTYSASTQKFTMKVTDTTLGKTLSVSQKCHSDQAGCPRNSAEVISEDIGGGTDTDGLFYLPDYGTATYLDVSVTNAAGHTGTLSDPAWNLGEVTEVSSTSVTKQNVSAISSNGSSFSTAWLHQ